MLKGKKILIGITGSIAAYKIPLLVRLLIKEGAEVKIIMTSASKDFVTPLTLSTLSGNPIFSDFFNEENGAWYSHVDLGNWADLYLIAPVSATTLGKMANGIADNLLVATYLAAKCQVFFAPAMDVDMFNHPSTQKNIKKLQEYGNILLEPDIGELASGLSGPGRLQEPENILGTLSAYFQKKKDFNGLKILITAGPTYEPIDPVRFIGNYSTGKMGFALAGAFANRGASVTLIAGPVSIKIEDPAINRINVTSANEMFEACNKAVKHADIIIMSAAVADYAPFSTATKKIKKKGSDLTLHLKPTPDILKHIGESKSPNQVLVGFALETNNELENAKQKLKNKNLDLIVLNSLQDKGAGFGHSTNKVTFIDRDANVELFELKSKKLVAEDVADKIKNLL